MAFDLDEFMNAAVQSAGDTKYAICPQGEFPMMLDTDVKVNEISGTSEKTGEPYHFHVLEAQCIVQDDKVRADLGRDKVTVRLRVNLDIENGRLEEGKGKNIRLNQLREALGQNTPGWKMAQLRGAGPFMGKVIHRPNEKDPERPFAEVSRVSAIRR
jgi:hypothetical protein